MKSKQNSINSVLLGLSNLLVRGSFVGAFAFAPAAWAETVIFSTPGTTTWTVPAGVTSVNVECRGGGGAGGSADAPTSTTGNVRGGGGAGGNYARTESIPVTPGQVYSVTVGGGGLAPTVSGTFTHNAAVTSGPQVGGSSSFKTLDLATTLVQATGGVGGPNGVRGVGINAGGGVQPALDSNTIGTVRFRGGNGGGAWGGTLGSGTGGGGAGDAANGGNGVANNATSPDFGRGIGGNAGGGNGAIGASLNNPGNAGSAPGGGGSGAARNSTTTGGTNFSIGGSGGGGTVTLTFAIDTGIAKYQVAGISPQAVTDGAGFDITITAQDTNGQTVPDSINIVTMTSPTAGSLMEFDWDGNGVFGDNSGTLVNGVKTIKARNKRAQTVTIVASTGAVTTETPLSITTDPGAFTKLQILAPGETAAPGTATGKTGAPTARTAGTSFNVIVNGVDDFWNVVSATDEVDITSTDLSAELPSSGDLFNGTITQGLSFLTPGTFTLTASNLTTPSIAAATTPNILVNAVTATWAAGTDDKWDVDTTPNWAGSVTFKDLNTASFTDAGGEVQPNVDIVGTVSPFSVSVNNTTTNYTLGTTGGGSISGVAGGFTKAGTGSLTVNTANTYSGVTSITGGVLRLGNANALPASSPLTIAGGVLGLGVGDFTRSLGAAAGQVQLTASNSGFAAYGANRAVNLGGASASLSFGDPGFFGGVGGNPALFLSRADATHTLDFQNPVVLTGVRFFNVPDGAALVDARLSGAITGATSFSKAGNGTLELTNSGNAWTTTTFLDSGTLRLGASDVLPGGTVEIKRAGSTDSNPILDLNGFSDTVGGITLGSLTTTGNSGQQVSIVNSAGGAATLTVTGGITYRAGTAALENGQATISANLNTGTGVRSFAIGDGAAAVDLAITGGFAGESISKTGAGVLSVASPGNTGNTTVTEGRLIVGTANSNNNASTMTIAAAGVLELNYTGTDQVTALVVNGVTQPDGAYGAAQHPGFITGTGTITVGSAPADPYVAWAGSAGVLFNNDENNDGVRNGLAWLLGASGPNVNATGLLPVVSESGGGLKLTFDMLPSAARGGSQLVLEHSSDLGIGDLWAGVVVPDASGGTAPVTFTVSDSNPGNPNNALDVEATISSSEAVGGKLFGRVRGNK